MNIFPPPKLFARPDNEKQTTASDRKEGIAYCMPLATFMGGSALKMVERAETMPAVFYGMVAVGATAMLAYNWHMLHHPSQELTSS